MEHDNGADGERVELKFGRREVTPVTVMESSLSREAGGRLRAEQVAREEQRIKAIPMDEDGVEEDKLLLNALKKLSLMHSGSEATQNDDLDSDNNNEQGGQNLDFSTFASLTRQPRMDSDPELVETSILNNLTSVSSELMLHRPSSQKTMSTFNDDPDSLTLAPMPRRRESSTNAMAQYEKRRPVSPSPILRGELLDLPPKNEDTGLLQDKRRPVSHTQSQQMPVKQEFKPATFSPASRSDLSILEYNFQPAPIQAPKHASAPVLPTKEEERYNKDPQSINKLKRPLYIPAVLRPNLANNYSEIASSSSSLGSENNDISRDLQRYKEYNNLGFGVPRGGGSPLNSVNMTSSVSQQSSISTSPGHQHTLQLPQHQSQQQSSNIIGKILERFTNSRSGSQISVVSSSSSPPALQSQRILSDASSVLSNSSLNQDLGPTREHWKPDSVLLRCTSCNKIFTNFGIIRRKHHCRSCGDIFCTNCINHYIYLDKDAKFALMDAKQGVPQPIKTEKYLSKVCYQCFENYENFLRQKDPSIFNVQVLRKPLDGEDEDEEDEVEDLQSSMGNVNGERRDSQLAPLNPPLDWNWSSF